MPPDGSEPTVRVPMTRTLRDRLAAAIAFWPGPDGLDHLQPLVAAFDAAVERPVDSAAKHEAFVRDNAEWNRQSEEALADLEAVARPAEADRTDASIRDLAVALVDQAHGYTMEFNGSPEAHAQEYDVMEDRLTHLLASLRLRLASGVAADG